MSDLKEGWNEVVNTQILQNIDRVKKTTRPLKEIFGIDYFTYHRINNKGQYTVLLDRPDWAEHYTNEKLYSQDPYLQHPDSYSSGFCFVEMNGSSSYKEQILQEGGKFKLDLGLCLIQKSENGVEFFGFSGSKQNSALNQLYLNHQPLLISFAKHFREEHTKTLKYWENDAPFLEDLKGTKLKRHPVQSKLNEEAHNSFLEALGMNRQIEYASLLSNREEQCLKRLLVGDSYKEIGSFLRLSSRTVESYFENIKNKFGCSSKKELFEIAQTLANLGLLP